MSTVPAARHDEEHGDGAVVADGPAHTAQQRTTIAAHSAASAAAVAASSLAHAAAASSASASVTAVPHDIPRVLSIQSSVVFGCVGNKASNFPLQLLGFDVDPLHSCQFSNHTNYRDREGKPQFSGSRTSAQDVSNIVSGLEKNDLLKHYSHVLAGYMTSVEFLERCVTLIEDLKRRKPSLLFVCDPVMGDNARLYVPEAFVSIYRDRLVHLADVVTPNQTECERLSGIAIRDEQSAVANLEWFHSRGVRTVVITSLSYPDAPGAPAGSPRIIHVLGSTIDSSLNPKAHPRPKQVAHLQFEYVDCYFTGTGDLAAALLLAWLTRGHEAEQAATAGNLTSAGEASPPCFSFATLCSALEHSMATLQAVIRRTSADKSLELRLIQSKNDIEHPVVTQRARIIELDTKA